MCLKWLIKMLQTKHSKWSHLKNFKIKKLHLVTFSNQHLHNYVWEVSVCYIFVVILAELVFTDISVVTTGRSLFGGVGCSSGRLSYNASSVLC